MTDLLLDTELPLGNNKYHISRMSVFDQMNIASEYRDILVGLALMKKERPKGMKEADFREAVNFIMASRGGVSPDTRSWVTSLCLRHVKRQQGGGWSPVLASEGVLQFSDIELPDIMALLYAVFEHNKLIDFFSASPSSSGGQTGTNTGPRSQMEKTG